MKELGIDRMNLEDRLALAEEILDSLAVECEVAPLTEAQRLDLQRRVAEYEQNPGCGSTWEVVKARLKSEA
jgi:putative addiction module component (TIGR02574 family)